MVYYDSYIEKIKNEYFDDNIKTFDDLITAAGKCYEHMLHFNIAEGKWSSYDNFDNPCVNFLAGWILNNRNYPFLKKYNERKLADEIGTKIINFQKNNNK